MGTHLLLLQTRDASPQPLPRHQDTGVLTNGAGCGAPAGHEAGGAGAGAVLGHSDRPHRLPQPYGPTQLQKHQIVNVGPTVVLGMWHLANHTQHLLGGFLLLLQVLLAQGNPQVPGP